MTNLAPHLFLPMPMGTASDRREKTGTTESLVRSHPRCEFCYAMPSAGATTANVPL